MWTPTQKALVRAFNMGDLAQIKKRGADTSFRQPRMIV